MKPEEIFSLQKDVEHGTKSYPFQVHETVCQTGMHLYPHMHREFEITYVVRGRGIFYVDGKEFEVAEGDGIVIPSEAIHLIKPIDEEKGEFFSIVFSSGCFGKPVENLLYDKFVHPFLTGEKLPNILWRKDGNGYEIFSSKVNRIRELYAQNQSELLCQAALFELWNLIYDTAEKGVPKGSSQRENGPSLADVLEYIDNNYGDNITVKLLAEQMNVSEGHFSRVFRSYTQTSPIRYLLNVRLRKSAGLLEQGEQSISEIALHSGFSDFSYYSKCFKKEYGCTPREWARKCRVY